MNLKWNAPEVLEYYFESRLHENPALNNALADFRKSSFFSPLFSECKRRRILQLLANRVLLVNCLLRNIEKSRATEQQRAYIQEDSDAFYVLLSAFCGCITKKQTLNVTQAWDYYKRSREQRGKELSRHMEQGFKKSWWCMFEARSALKLIPDLLHTSVFLLQHARRLYLTDAQKSELLHDEKMYYSYLVRAIREI